jgi:hypothetical protein
MDKRDAVQSLMDKATLRFMILIIPLVKRAEV